MLAGPNAARHACSAACAVVASVSRACARTPFTFSPIAPATATDVALGDSTVTCRENFDYNGSRWQPNMPRPPQFRRGVSCICTVSAGPPELLGRRALTAMGSCGWLVLQNFI